MEKILSSILNVLSGVVWWIVLAIIILASSYTENTDSFAWIVSTILQNIAIIFLILSAVIISILAFLSRSWKKFLIWFFVCLVLFSFIKFSWFIWDVLI